MLSHPSNATVRTRGYADILCNAIYPSSLFIMQGVLEGLVCLFILFMSKGVAAYVASTTTYYSRVVVHGKRKVRTEDIRHSLIILM